MTREQEQKLKREISSRNVQLLHKYFPQAMFCDAGYGLILVQFTEIQAIAEVLAEREETVLYVHLNIEGLEIKTFDGECCSHYFIDCYDWTDKDGTMWFRLDMDEYIIDALERGSSTLDIIPVDIF